MPPCKNSSTGYYTGKEPSPKGFGYCAHSEEVGKRRIGNDGDMWIVQQDRIGRLAWKKNAATPKNAARRTSKTPTRNNARRTPGTPRGRNTPKCRPDQIVNPRTNRCVSKHGKIGQQLLSHKGSKRETVRRGMAPSTAPQKFGFLTAYPRSNSASRLTATEMQLAKQFGITILGHQIDQDNIPDRNGNVSTLDGYGYATSRLDVRDWLQRIGAKPIQELERI